jgi:20S proteasome subunit alpha 4
VDYAFEAVKRGGLSIGIVGKDLVLLVSERKTVPKLQDSRTINKVSKVDSHVFICYSGIIADSRSLIDYARLESQSYRYSLNTEPSIDYIAKKVAFRQQDYTQRAGVRPFGISTLIAGFDLNEQPKLYLTEPSGGYSAWLGCAIGKNAQKVNESLEKEWKENMTYEEVLFLAVDLITQYVESDAKNLEIGYMRKGEQMQYENDEVVEQVIKQLDEKRKKETVK